MVRDSKRRGRSGGSRRGCYSGPVLLGLESIFAMEYDEFADADGHGAVDSAMEARFENLKLIGKGSFGDVFHG